MFGPIAKIPKLALLGLIVLLIGFSPEILATVNYDIVPPTIIGTLPYGDSSHPYPLTLNEPITLRLVVFDSGDIDKSTVNCLVGLQSFPDIMPVTVSLKEVPPHDRDTLAFEGSWTPTRTDSVYTFMFHVWDTAKNRTTKLAYGIVGNASGDFYMKDGNDPDWTLVSRGEMVTFNHRLTYFKFITDQARHGADITRVWIKVMGQTEFDLTETVPDTEWNGSTWEAPSDGTYTIYGYISAFGRNFTGLSILVGTNEEPTPPSEWSTFDWLKIIGVALVVVGFIVKK